MFFKNRRQAGILLSKKLNEFGKKDTVVYALPRGGILTAAEIARNLSAPLDLIIARKISHPLSSEYAIAAISESGQIITNKDELTTVDKDRLETEMEKKREEAFQMRRKYLGRRKIISPKGKIAILVDDGVATGLTLRAGILELKRLKPLKLIVAVSVVPQSTAKIIEKEVDKLVALDIPTDDSFLDAVGAYYEDFSQVDDSEVIRVLESYSNWFKKRQQKTYFKKEKI